MIPFEDVYRQHAGPVYRFCLSQVVDGAIAEDIAATAFEQAFRAYERVRPDPVSVRPWLFRIVRNLVIDHHRGNQRLQRYMPRIFWSGQRPSQDAEAIVAERDAVTAICVVIAGLKPRDRALIGLRLAADLSYSEIASITGIPERNARVAIHRAIARIRARVGERA